MDGRTISSPCYRKKFRFRKEVLTIADDLNSVYAFINDLWLFEKKYFAPKDDGDFWAALVDEVDVISRKYNSLYADMMLCVCANDIEARYYASKGRPVDSHLQLERAMKLYDTFAKRRRNDNGKSEM